ncbi:hypothetical protein [Chondromyces crocatus]|uniref:Lipoprotein n=1 Tax=Chondromyces crocatus TaxID=52 RepID=A0A0K1EIT1_CHOCO|nr:hypothetical protein [Chondromyces crocatus]AKT40770.1 uncharacterized protein CMC5_049260 [Chondromyces crocatus]
MIRRLALPLPLLSGLLLGCEPSLSALTVSPVGTQAELDSHEETITLTKGIALGFHCTYNGRACENATAEVEHAAVATVYPAYVDMLSRSETDYRRNVSTTPRSVFVIVGSDVGATTLTLRTDDGDLDFAVDIVDR